MPDTIKLNLALVQAKIRQVQRVIDQKKIEEISPVIIQAPNTTEEETDSSKGPEKLMTDELKRGRTGLSKDSDLFDVT